MSTSHCLVCQMNASDNQIRDVMTRATNCTFSDEKDFLEFQAPAMLCEVRPASELKKQLVFEALGFTPGRAFFFFLSGKSYDEGERTMSDICIALLKQLA